VLARAGGSICVDVCAGAVAGAGDNDGDGAKAGAYAMLVHTKLLTMLML
jgi:hypothetical protein